MKGGKKTSACFCLGAAMRALSRACDSACDLYVRGMSGCAGRVPAGAAAGGRGSGGFGRSATIMHMRASSDRAGDLVFAALKQRRVVAEPADVGAAKKMAHISQPPAAVPARRKGPAMVSIAEDATCEFGACALQRPERRRRGGAVGGLGSEDFDSRAFSGFGAIKVRSEAFDSRA